jgi:hypothetical protein
MEKKNLKILGGNACRGALALITMMSPLAAFATGFGSGMVIPAGTTTNVTSALTTYLFPTILATLFQVQVIEILVVLAAVVLCYYVVKLIIRKVSHPHR